MGQQPALMFSGKVVYKNGIVHSFEITGEALSERDL